MFGPRSNHTSTPKRKSHKRRVLEVQSPAQRIVSLQTETRQALEDLRADVTQRQNDLRELEALVERYEGLLLVPLPSTYAEPARA